LFFSSLSQFIFVTRFWCSLTNDVKVFLSLANQFYNSNDELNATIITALIHHLEREGITHYRLVYTIVYFEVVVVVLSLISRIILNLTFNLLHKSFSCYCNLFLNSFFSGQHFICFDFSFLNFCFIWSDSGSASLPTTPVRVRQPPGKHSLTFHLFNYPLFISVDCVHNSIKKF
jgi:hypothetical protein